MSMKCVCLSSQSQKNRFFQSIIIVNLLSLLITSIWVKAFTGWFDWIVLLNCLGMFLFVFLDVVLWLLSVSAFAGWFDWIV